MNTLSCHNEQVGSDRIVFGTDTPLYFSPMQVQC
jgi:hypothetical protein